MQGEPLPTGRGSRRERVITTFDSQFARVGMHLRTIYRDGMICTAYEPSTVDRGGRFPLMSALWLRGSRIPRYDGSEGELYDVRNDPEQWENLWDDPSRRRLRDELCADLRAHLPEERLPRLTGSPRRPDGRLRRRARCRHGRPQGPGALLPGARSSLVAQGASGSQNALPWPFHCRVLTTVTPPADPSLPTGTVTFLFTDLEGSTQLWEDEPERMRPALARHDALVRAAVVSNGGTVVKMTGDGVYAAFDDPVGALAAAVAIQRAFVDSGTTGGLALRVRGGVHLGAVERRDDDYFGGPVNRASRIMSAAHGGQILLSKAVVDHVRKRLPPPSTLRDLGRMRLKDLALPEHVYQLVHPQLRQDFPALRSLEMAPNNLPQQISSFIGRERELAEVKRLLAQSRLLTLVGIGGIGKTRLMLQAAADSIDAYPDGAGLVELGSIADPLLVPSSVAQVLSVLERAGTPLHADALQSSQVTAPVAGARQLRAPDRRLCRPFCVAAGGGAGLPHPCQQP